MSTNIPSTTAPSVDPLRKLFGIFLSYSSKDLPKVRDVRDVLATANLDVFFADESVEEGERLSAKIHAALRSCDLFVLIWSTHAKKSGWVNQEIGAAISQGKKILPIVLDGTDLPDLLRDVKYLSTHDQYAETHERLKKIAEGAADRKTIAYIIAAALLIWAICIALKKH